MSISRGSGHMSSSLARLPTFVAAASFVRFSPQQRGAVEAAAAKGKLNRLMALHVT